MMIVVARNGQSELGEAMHCFEAQKNKYIMMQACLMFCVCSSDDWLSFSHSKIRCYTHGNIATGREISEMDTAVSRKAVG